MYICVEIQWYRIIGGDHHDSHSKYHKSCLIYSQNNTFMDLIWLGSYISYLLFFAFFTDSIGLHRVENVSHTDTAASLHVYIPAFDMCQSFDQRTGHKRKCQVTFWSKYGIRTPYVSPYILELVCFLLIHSVICSFIIINTIIQC